MRQETRFKFNAYLSRVAELNGIDAGDVSKKFTVEPSVTQTLMNTMQESSDFLTRINIVPVSEMKGEKIGIGVTGSIASTTDTAGGTERQPKDFSKLASNKYECDQINFDFYIRYKTLDLWARYQDFQLRIRNAIIKRQSLDFIMAGFNGVKRAETSDRSSNPMLQDVAVGWLQKYRNEAPARVMSKVTDEEGHTTSEVIRVGIPACIQKDACVLLSTMSWIRATAQRISRHSSSMVLSMLSAFLSPFALASTPR